MAVILKDRVKETTTTIGTGTLTLGGAALGGFQTFNDAIGVGNQCYYAIENSSVNEWEVGLGTVATSNTLARNTVYGSSNGGGLVSFSSGLKSVWVTDAAERGKPDSIPVAAGSADATKQVRLEVDGLTTATTRVVTIPDANFIAAGRDVVQTFTQNQVVDSRFACGPDGAINTSLIYTIPTFTAALNVQEEPILTGGDGDFAASIQADFLLNPAVESALEYYGIHCTVFVKSGNDKDIGDISAISGEVVHEGTGAVDAMTGLAYTVRNASTGTVDEAFCLSIGITADVTPPDNIYAIYVNVTAEATGDHYCFYSESGTMLVLCGFPGLIGVQIKGAASQSANLLECVNSSSAMQFSVGPGGNTLIAGALDHNGTTVGFFGTTPATQPTAFTQTYATATKTHANPTSATLTDSTGGSANTTLVDVTGADTVDKAKVHDNFADLAAQVNALRVDLLNAKQVINSIIDDNQSLGLAL